MTSDILITLGSSYHAGNNVVAVGDNESQKEIDDQHFQEGEKQGDRGWQLVLLVHYVLRFEEGSLVAKTNVLLLCKTPAAGTFMVSVFSGHVAKLCSVFVLESSFNRCWELIFLNILFSLTFDFIAINGSPLVGDFEKFHFDLLGEFLRFLSSPFVLS